MRKKRFYVALPEDEFELFRYWAAKEGRCHGMMAQFLICVALYREAQRDPDLQAKQLDIINQRREKVISGRLD